MRAGGPRSASGSCCFGPRDAVQQGVLPACSAPCRNACPAACLPGCGQALIPPLQVPWSPGARAPLQSACSAVRVAACRLKRPLLPLLPRAGLCLMRRARLWTRWSCWPGRTPTLRGEGRQGPRAGCARGRPEAWECLRRGFLALQTARQRQARVHRFVCTTASWCSYCVAQGGGGGGGRGRCRRPGHRHSRQRGGACCGGARGDAAARPAGQGAAAGAAQGAAPGAAGELRGCQPRGSRVLRRLGQLPAG